MANRIVKTLLRRKSLHTSCFPSSCTYLAPCSSTNDGTQRRVALAVGYDHYQDDVHLIKGITTNASSQRRFQSTKKTLSSSSTGKKKTTLRFWEYPASDGRDERKRGTLYDMSNLPSSTDDNDDPNDAHTRRAFTGEDPTAVSDSPDGSNYNKLKRSWQQVKFESQKQVKSETDVITSGDLPPTSRILKDTAQDALSHFLPAHYPDSVAPGYLRFASFSFVASVAGSAAMVLSTQTLLLAVGVVGATSSHQQASIMAGALNWILKDFVGQLGGVLFASQMGKTRALDADPKRWRMVATLALDASTLLEILCPLCHPSWVLPMASVANVGKNVGFLTASASRAALHNALTRSGNLADVTAKAGSQSLLASLVGTTLGIGLSSNYMLAHDTHQFAMGFCVLAMIHQGCNYVSLQSVILDHFNEQRLSLVLEHYLKEGVVLSPAKVATLESYFPLPIPSGRSAQTREWLSIGSKLEVMCPNPAELESLFLLNDTPKSNYVLCQRQGRIHLVYAKEASGEDLIRGMHHASVLKEESKMDFPYSSSGTAIRQRSTTRETESHSDDDDAALFQRVQVQAQKRFQDLLMKLQENEWKTETAVTSIESRSATRIHIDKES